MSQVSNIGADAGQIKNLQVQDEIAVSVIWQVQDQQQQLAEQLVEMMQHNQVDIYA